jgi:hypothetical protein
LLPMIFRRIVPDVEHFVPHRQPDPANFRDAR